MPSADPTAGPSVSPSIGPSAGLVAKAEVFAASGFFDEGFYGRLRGRSFASTLEAALDYVTWGMAQLVSPNPHLLPGLLPGDIRRAWKRGRVRVVLAHLRSAAGAREPVGDAPALGAAVTGLADAFGQGAAYLFGAGAGVEVAPQVDWHDLEAGLAHRVAGRTSVVVPTFRDATMTGHAVEAVLRTTQGADVEVVVVDNGSGWAVSAELLARLCDDGRVRFLRLPANLNFAGGSNAGFAVSTGDRVVFLNNDTEVRHGWLAPLVGALDDPEVAGVQPLLLYDDDTIQTAGTVFLRSDLLPCHLLVGHPPSAAEGVAGRRFSAVTAAAMALRAQDIVRLRGFDESYVNGFEDVDLCLRALRLRPGGFRVVPSARVTHYESRTPGRYARVHENRRLFWERWKDHLPPLDAGVHSELGLPAPSIGTDGQPVPAAVVAFASRDG